jgi:hypothetical protein
MPSGDTHVVYWGSNSKYYHGIYSGGAWNTGTELVGPILDGGLQPSFGNSPPTATITLIGGSAAFRIAQAGTDMQLYDQAWWHASQTWAPAEAHMGSSIDPASVPRIITLHGGMDDAMIVYWRAGDGVLMYTTHNATSGWSRPLVADATASSPYPVSITEIAGSPGRAVVVYEGADAHAYFSTYDPTRGLPWSPKQPLIPGGGPPVLSPPQLASGVCGDEAELVLAGALLGTADNVQVWSLAGGAWTATAALSGMGATFAAIATSP